MPNPSNPSTKEQRIAELARRMPGVAIHSLSQHMDIEWLREAYRRTRKDGAPGVDGQSAVEYEEQLDENLQKLLDDAKSGRYRAPPVRRVHIPKGDGKETRPLGIPTLGDKVLQRAVVMLLEPVYEQEFLDCSHGYRPKRSAHSALESFWSQMMKMGGGWVLEVDVRKFFDTLDHQALQDVVRQRVTDGVVLRLIGKWLNAGVMEEERVEYPSAGTPQGGVISPLLANIFLHEVLDKWFERDVKPRLRGRAFLIRYADDFVIGFEREDDARRVMAVLARRMEKYGLALHPDKTRLLPFRPTRDDENTGAPGPGSFDLLGFTHFWAKSRVGNWVIKRKTSSKRFTRALKAVREWCRRVRSTLTQQEQHAILSRKLRGHYGYYGITGNSRALVRFAFEANRIWRQWLSRRSDKAGLSWKRFRQYLRRFPLPPPRATHSVLRRANL